MFAPRPTPRPPRLRPVSPATVDRAAAAEPGTSDAELYDALDAALAALPAQERAAALVAFGDGFGSAGVASQLTLAADDAEALTRSALQLLRGALAGIEPDAAEPHPRLPRRRRLPAGGDDDLTD